MFTFFLVPVDYTSYESSEEDIPATRKKPSPYKAPPVIPAPPPPPPHEDTTLHNPAKSKPKPKTANPMYGSSK